MRVGGEEERKGVGPGNVYALGRLCFGGEVWQRGSWFEYAKKKTRNRRSDSLQMHLLPLLAVGRDLHHPVAGSPGAVANLALLVIPVFSQAGGP
jgi:hypothetical protein